MLYLPTLFFFFVSRRTPRSPLFPYTTLFRSRLRHRQGGGESSRIANAASRHHRPLSGSAARYLGNLCGPRGTSSTHPAHAASQRQTHSWSEARPASAAGPHALPGALLLPRRRWHLHYPRLISTDPAGTPGDTGRVQAWIPPL